MNEESLPPRRGPEVREGVGSHGVLSKYFGWVRYVTVEPTMWLYMMAFMVTSVVEQDLFIYKACRVDHNLSEAVCRNLSGHAELKKKILVTVTEFHQWNEIAGHFVPIVLALFLGNWSDKRGRKFPLVIGLVGKVIYSGMVVVNMIMTEWSLSMIIYTATLPMGMFGGDVAIFASSFAYISDVSSHKQRTFRVTILDIAYLSTMPTGIALGSFLFNRVFDKSYTIMFAINTTLLILSVIYSMIVLKWQTNECQKPVDAKNMFLDFFDKDHVTSTVETITRDRPNSGRLRLWILFLTMALYTFQRDEKRFNYLYTKLVFNWDVSSYSRFRTFQSSLFVIAMLVGARTLDRILGDTYIVAVGAVSHALGRILFATAQIPQLFYIGALFAALGPIVAPTLRSMTSKVVPPQERGKAFAILSVCDTAVPLVSVPLYTQVYNRTCPSAIYWLTFATQVCVLILILVVRGYTRESKPEKIRDNEVGEPKGIRN